MSSLTCMTCQVRFSDADLHRSHFKGEKLEAQISYNAMLNTNNKSILIPGDWHRYNLKRKVAQLPIVSCESFEERRTAHEAEVKVAEKCDKEPCDYCVACGKNFKNPKAYENHIASKKHQEMILKFDKQPPRIVPEVESDGEDIEDDDDGDMEIEEVDSDEWEDDPIEKTDCLFCNHHSSSLEKNLTHMTTVHSFFLPDPEYICDLDGLIEYLGAKVR